MIRRLGIIPLLAVLVAGIAGARLVHEWTAHDGAGDDWCVAGGDSCHAAHGHSGSESNSGSDPSAPRGPERNRAPCSTCDLLAVAVTAAPADAMLAAPTMAACVGGTAPLHVHAPALTAPAIVRARPPPVG